MLRKIPKKQQFFSLKGVFKAFIAFELTLLAGSYFTFNRLNNSSDFRHRLHKDWPFILEAYYNIDETVGTNSIRQSDYKAWGLK